MKLNIRFCIITLCALLFASCAPYKDLPYIVGAEKLPDEVVSSKVAILDPVIGVGDEFTITVTGGPEFADPTNPIAIFTNPATGTETYLVDEHGYIKFPVLGKVHIAGLRKAELEEKIASMIAPKYLANKPVVDVRLRNFRVYFMGEVSGQVTSPTGRLNILEALSYHHFPETADRRNVMLIRTNPDGTRIIRILNLQDKNLLLSEYFNLQQNDILYVRPNLSRTMWKNHPLLNWGTAMLGTIVSVSTLLVVLSKKF